MQKSRKKIVLLSSYTLPDFSGSGRNAFQFARFLSGNGHRVTLLTFNRNLVHKSCERIQGVNLRRIPYIPDNLLLKFVSLFVVIPCYIYHLLRNSIVVIYGSKIIAYELIIIFGRLLGKKLVFRSLLMGVDDMGTLTGKKPAGGFYQFLFRLIDLYFSINPEFSRLFLDRYPQPGKLFGSFQGTDTSLFHPVSHDEKMELREHLGIDREVFVILSVGFVVSRKGHMEIIPALKELGFPFLYILVGEFHFDDKHFMRREQDYAGRIVEYGTRELGSRILFTGARENISDYMKAADLFLHNSTREGTPNTLLEAMSCGLCPVVRRLPGLDGNLLQHQTNAIVFDDAGMLKPIIGDLFLDHKKRKTLGRNARKYVEMHASFPAVVQEFIEKIQ